MVGSNDASPYALMDKCFGFLKDLTKKHKRANIVVDEVKLENLIKQQEIHFEDFEGTDIVDSYLFCVQIRLQRPV